MPLKFIRSLIALSCLSMAVSPALYARDPEDAAKQSAKASKVFQEIMAAPDKAIPTSVLDKAQCIAVFPQVLKAGFIFGGRGGRGVASCRVDNGWSDPAYFDLKGGSFGLQIGAQATDFVLLFMNHDGMKSLLKNKFEMGGDASPVLLGWICAGGRIVKTLAAIANAPVTLPPAARSGGNSHQAGIE